MESFSVSQITKEIKDTLLKNLQLKNIWVQGEISNLSQSSSGHIYFSLKDAKALLRCTLFNFRGFSINTEFLKDGLEIKVLGSINVYEPSGSYSLNISRIERIGKGDILYEIEQLKLSLEKRGIFRNDHKKPLPNYPLTLGIATSPTGAAVNDIIKIAHTRFPNLNIIVAPCLVQGEGAVSSIVNAIQCLNESEYQIDVIIAGRGGGSFEDLMAFNTEEVVMAFYNSKIPIISAVGHQIDTVLTDFVADEHAPTPTAAAEMAIPNIKEIESYWKELDDRMRVSLGNRRLLYHDKLISLLNRYILQEPFLIVQNRIQKFDEIMKNLQIKGNHFIFEKKVSLSKIRKLQLNLENIIKTKKNELKHVFEKVENLSHKKTLSRGYSILRNKNNKIIKSSSEIELDEELELILSDANLRIINKGIYHE